MMKRAIEPALNEVRMKYLILIALVSISAAQAAQHDFGNGNCRSCNGGEWTQSTSPGNVGGWACSGTAGPLEICGKAVMGHVVKDASVDLGGGAGGPRKAISSPAASKKIAR